MTERALLLSLRPRFAEAILDGEKTTELRRRPINAQPGTWVILYASAPTMAIVGIARLGNIEATEPDEAWERYQNCLALEESEFYGYLDGTKLAYLLHLGHIRPLERPLPLDELRRSGDFQPPQSFRYVAPTDPRPLRDLVERRSLDPAAVEGKPRARSAAPH